MSTVCLMGYSGHSYVVYDTVKTMGVDLKHYCEISQIISNPYNLDYLGTEQVALQQGFFENLIPVLAIGDNELRMRIGNFLSNAGIKLFTAIHAKSYIASNVSIGEGTVVFAGVVINPLVEIGQGVICNTNCIIEHESSIGEFSHICPGAVLTGNVKIGKRVFIGANAVIKQGLTIGDGAIVGAGSVVVKNVDANTIVYGNPSTIKS
jgi:acetyltransferase EpsM